MSCILIKQKPEGQTNPSNILDTTPEFSALYNDPNSSDLAPYFRIQVATSTDWSYLVWDSGTTTMATTTEGTRSNDLSYSGSTLTPSTTYYWRIKFSDDDTAEGAWSTETATFSLSDISSQSGSIQSISYTYDAVGNITGITDHSTGGQGKIIQFSYDSLYRLTMATTTSATSTPFKHTFSYSSLGNLTGMATSTATTTYAYAGTSYANPHAPTSIGGTTVTYDNNGNVTAYGSNTYTWDYRNRMAQSVGSNTSTYGYDYQGQRVSMKVGNTASTTYANRYYSTNGATTTKHIYAGGTLIAITTKVNNATTTNIIHTDHLGGTNVVTDADGDVAQTVDYYPFGSERISSGTDTTDRHYIGERYDSSSGLNYLNARYYEGSRGQFLSQDPVHLVIGDSYQIRQLTQQDQIQILIDPQLLNSYSYGRNNPLRYTDPEGEWIQLGVLIIIGGFLLAADNAAPDFYKALELKNAQIQGDKTVTPEDIKEKLNKGAFSLFEFPVSFVLPTPVGELLDIKGYLQKFKELFRKNDNSSNNQSSSNVFLVKNREEAVQSYNASKNATSPQDKLWVTPSGAVVTWGGEIKEDPPTRE